MPLFAFAITAKKQRTYEIACGSVVSPNIMTARIEAFEECLDAFPTSEGYHGHAVLIHEVPEHVMS